MTFPLAHHSAMEDQQLRLNTLSNTFLPLRFSVLLTIIFFALVSSHGIAVAQSPTMNASETAYTPPSGSPLRKAILDSLRREVLQTYGLQVVFVVDSLLVKDGWAWLDTRPQSQDGTSNYEDISALLHKDNGSWKVIEIPCTEVENPDCLDDEHYVEHLQQRFPSAPLPFILPQTMKAGGN